jgi:hypothetical protein
MSSIEQYITKLGQDGFRFHLWRTRDGWQANISEPGTNAWTCVTLDDPVDATREALRQRACGISSRIVQAHSPQHDAPIVEHQVDIEEAIEAAAAPDPFADLIG